jgi:hypothetical protein
LTTTSEQRRTPHLGAREPDEDEAIEAFGDGPALDLVGVAETSSGDEPEGRARIQPGELAGELVLGDAPAPLRAVLFGDIHDHDCPLESELRLDRLAMAFEDDRAAARRGSGGEKHREKERPPRHSRTHGNNMDPFGAPGESMDMLPEVGCMIEA